MQALVDTAKGTGSVRVDTSSAAAPWLAEDFSTYTSTANMLSDPRGIYSVTEDEATNRMTLDQTTGVNINGLNLTQSMRYDYPGPGCTSQTVTRNISLPTNVRELWVEVYMKFSNNFDTRNVNGCTTPPDFKTLFGRLTNLQCRFEFHVGGADGGQAFNMGGPGCANGVAALDLKVGDAHTVWDGQWHRYRFHWFVDSTGTNHQFVWYLDNTLMFSKTSGWANDGQTAQIYGIALGRNLDQGIPSGTMSLWWGTVRVWNKSPGW